MTMRILVTAVTVLFTLVGAAGLVGGITEWCSAGGGMAPDGLAEFNSGFIISLSLLTLAAAALFAKANWPPAPARRGRKREVGR